MNNDCCDVMDESSSSESTVHIGRVYQWSRPTAAPPPHVTSQTTPMCPAIRRWTSHGRYSMSRPSTLTNIVHHKTVTNVVCSVVSGGNRRVMGVTACSSRHLAHISTVFQFSINWFYIWIWENSSICDKVLNLHLLSNLFSDTYLCR